MGGGATWLELDFWSKPPLDPVDLNTHSSLLLGLSVENKYYMS